MYVAIAALVFIVLPMAGLTVDVGYLYSAKARLQASVDGAALAAARSLNLGQTITAQEASATQNAVNWFYGNFPPGTWLTSSTVMDSSTVSVFPDATNAQLAHVNVTATTTVPTFFLKWLNIQNTTISAVGGATRRAVVAMLVLDRSGSMCNGGTTPCGASKTTLPCAAMINAAKQFTGSFSEGRDYIGLVSFADNAFVHSVPSQDFQTTLGFSNTSSSGSGEIDKISCDGNTSTAAAMAMAYQLLWQTALPGALNFVMLETDGQPNSMALNFWDSTHSVAGIANASGCTDTNGKKKSVAGSWASTAVLPAWSPGLDFTKAPFLTVTGGLPNIPAGIAGTVVSSDPGTTTFGGLMNYWTAWSVPAGSPLTTPQSYGTAADPFRAGQLLQTSTYYTSTALQHGCSFPSGNVASLTDLAWFPATDAFGNSLNPSYTPSAADYQTVSTDAQGHIQNNTWANFHAAALNATENSAYRARYGALSLSGTPFQPYVFVIGLGGNGGPLDPVLMQRIANDPSGDTFNVPADYPACNTETACYTFTNTPTGGIQQPQGKFVYSPSKSQLAQAFLAISSQVLRLSH
jgi:Flp pilus assembly protein TadG